MKSNIFYHKNQRPQRQKINAYFRDMSSFENKVALITGAASGIGRATALKFAQKGSKVLVSDIAEGGGKETVNLIKEQGGEAVFFKANVANEEQVKALVQHTLYTYGRLDFAVNNAGVGTAFKPTHESATEDWNFVISVNLSGVFFCMREEIPHMLANEEGGAIVNISSAAGVGGFAMQSAYAASKHGVIGLTRTAALEYAKYGIRCNAICPAFTRTQMVNQIFEIKPDWEEKLKYSIPMRRYGTPEEIADGIIWLCSPESSFVTGHALLLDGGMKA